MESHGRSVLKAMTWRAGGLVMTMAVAWIVTGQFEIAVSIGILDTVLKLGAFYVHERLWLRIRFGKPAETEYEI